MGSAKGLLTHKWLTHMLTDTKLRTLKPRESAYRVADTNSLCIEVRPSGARWVLECLDTVRGGRGVAPVAEVATLAGLRGRRLETALAWLKLKQAIEIVGRGEDAWMRIPTILANDSVPVLPRL